MENTINNGGKLKVLVSYGGRIVSRPTDGQLSYVGGDTKILAVDRRAKFSEIAGKLSSIANRRRKSEICAKYQLPGEDLDALVSLIDDDDVRHMVIEYDRMQRISTKPARLRIFLFDIDASPPAKSDLDTRPWNPDYLFGFDKEYNPKDGPPPLDLPENTAGSDLQPHQCTDNHVPVAVSKESSSTRAAVAAGIPAVSTGGVYQNRAFPNGIGNWDKLVYVVPIIPSAACQKK